MARPIRVTRTDYSVVKTYLNIMIWNKIYGLSETVELSLLIYLIIYFCFFVVFLLLVIAVTI